MSRLCLLGASGKMGQKILSLLSLFPSLELCSAICSPSSSSLNRGVETLPSLTFTANTATGIASSDIVIDFSTPAVLSTHIAACVAAKKPLVIGTTGYSEEDKKKIEEASKVIPILVAPNFSLGVFATTEAAVRIASTLENEAEVSIIDIHHRHKKDAPSGTALHLKTHMQPFFTKDIPIVSLRTSNVVGEHSIIFESEFERIELKHQAFSRKNFALGALKAAVFLQTQAPGLYTIKDLIQHKLNHK